MLVGLIVGIVMAVAAGARRTGTAYERFVRHNRGADVLVVNYPEDGTAVFDFEKVAELPQVVTAAAGAYEYVGDFGAGTAAIAPYDERYGSIVNAFEILEGRAADPSEPGEVVVAFDLAERYGLEVGERIELIDLDEARAYLAAAPLGERPFVRELIERVERTVPGGFGRVVGIEAAPGEFPPQYGANGPLIHLTPAAVAALGMEKDHQAMAVRLRRGESDVPDFMRGLERMAAGRPIEAFNVHDQHRATQRSIDFQVTALWLLAAMTAAVGLVVLGQALARAAVLEARDRPVLAALGMSRGQLFRTGMVRWGMVAAAGASAGAAVAVALSSLLPTGLARRAEPDPGLHVDWGVIGVGAIGAIAAVLTLSAVPTWRAAGLASKRAERTSRVAALGASAGLSVPAVTGLRLALERGGGPTAPRAGTTIAGVGVAVGVMAAAISFGASLEHLLTTPELYGQRWDRVVPDYEAGWSAAELQRAADLRNVRGVAGGDLDIPVEVDGRRVEAVAFTTISGDIGPPVLAGRLPTDETEIALGTRTLEQIDKSVGDTVKVRFAGVGHGRALQVVGRVVLPTLGSGAQLGKGAVLTSSVFNSVLHREPDRFGAMFLGVTAGADPDVVLAEITERFGRENVAALPVGEPDDIVNFGRVEAMPLVLAFVVAVLAAATLTHTLVSSIRRRRHDFAILRTVGFVRGQLVSSVLWQSTTVITIALIIGLPVGVAAGSSLWQAFCGQLGIVAEVHTPALSVLALIPAAVFVANSIALMPALLAGRASPAGVLRT